MRCVVRNVRGLVNRTTRYRMFEQLSPRKIIDPVEHYFVPTAWGDPIDEVDGFILTTLSPEVKRSVERKE